MSKIKQKPLECRKAHCGGTCSFMEASHYGDTPYRCPSYICDVAAYEEQVKRDIANQTLDDFMAFVEKWNSIPLTQSLTTNDLRKLVQQFKDRNYECIK